MSGRCNNRVDPLDLKVLVSEQKCSEIRYDNRPRCSVQSDGRRFVEEIINMKVVNR